MYILYYANISYNSVLEYGPAVGGLLMFFAGTWGGIMEDKTFRKGLTVAAIILIVITAILMSLSSTNGILYGTEAVLYGIPFIAAVAIMLLAILIILTRFYTRTDTIEEMLGAIAVRYGIFGWCFIFIIKFASVLLNIFCYDFYSEHFASIYVILNSINVCVIGTTVLAIALRKLPVVKIEKRKMKIGQLLLLIMMMYGLTQVGSMMGLPIHMLLTSFSSFTADSEDAINELSNNVVFSSGSLRSVSFLRSSRSCCSESSLLTERSVTVNLSAVHSRASCSAFGTETSSNSSLHFSSVFCLHSFT